MENYSDTQTNEKRAGNCVAVLDIGTTKIVAMIGRINDEGKIEVVDFCKAASKGIRRGEVLNLDDASMVISQVVSGLEKRVRMKISHVYVGVAGQHIEMIATRSYINRIHPDDKISEEELRNLCEDAYNSSLPAGKEIIHVIPQSYIVDKELDITNPAGMIGRRLEGNFSVIVGDIDSLKRIRRCVEDSHLKIEEIVLEPLASADAVLFPREKNTGVMLVDIGGGTTDIAIFYDNMLRYSAVIPFGGDIISEDIRKGVGLTLAEAEKLKIDFGMAISDGSKDNTKIIIPCEIPGQKQTELQLKHLTGIIQARMEEIIDQIVFHLEQSGYAGLLGSGIVITGGGSMLRHMIQLMSYKTGLNVRIGFPSQFLSGKAEQIQEPRFATAVGLIVQGLQHMEKHPEAAVNMPAAIEMKPVPEKPVPGKTDPGEKAPEQTGPKQEAKQDKDDTPGAKLVKKMFFKTMLQKMLEDNDDDDRI